ncbi:bromodomain-containing transcriptional activator [Encephalitozoon intestinalis ATCC 50506]|uniref:histone acetyltransferase n=1 Tax=Encephalitozoon intestinalis (strain ATCC 50506) TaxID=876142 RepID=E0S9S8_ENCIT|nr:bromodomain-containing transcriptional activator [Encephalitozoon intestinalis ATCC 50506]ADM12463.1 bromodomain-containing transcriptional activator [Encephalitozoon intestinalis ATCC 50506]UTX46299.1 histone acetyltransferase GCN5 [Encephalitozoon intestinalis]
MDSVETNLFGLERNQTWRNEKEMLYAKFKNGELKAVVVSSSDPCVDKILLLRTKYLFQNQLSKMPGEYILRQVFDTKHANLVLLNSVGEVVGGICYRPFFERNFVEIVFLAVDYDFQVKGIGGFMMDLFKEVIKEEIRSYFEKPSNGLSGSPKQKNRVIEDLTPLLCRTPESNAPSLYLVTYADNFAIGYFKKQGFTTEIRFGGWIGFIKDYEGGTIVECCVLWEINYLKKQEIIQDRKRKLFEEMKKVNEYHIIRKIDDYSEIKDVNDIPGVLNARYSAEETNDQRCQDRFISYLISDLCINAYAWPFLKPVDPKEVPNYYKCISKPMDLSTMSSKLKNNEYKFIEAFVEDVNLMVNNCFTYNGKDTQYYKCAQKLLNHFNRRLEFYKHVVDKLPKKKEIN